MSGSMGDDDGPPRGNWRKGLSRVDLGYGTGFSLVAVVLVLWASVTVSGSLYHPGFFLVEIAVALATLYLFLRLLDFLVRRVAVVHYRMVSRDPETVWGMVYRYLSVRGVPFQWVPHNPLFTGRQERRLELEDEDGNPTICIVVKAPKLRRTEVTSVIELECPDPASGDIGEVKRLVDEALVATMGLDGRVVEAVKRPRLVLYDYQGSHKR